MERRRNKRIKMEELYGDDEPYDALAEEQNNEEYQHEKILEKV